MSKVTTRKFLRFRAIFRHQYKSVLYMTLSFSLFYFISKAGRSPGIDPEKERKFVFPQHTICKDYFELSLEPKTEKSANATWPCLVRPPADYNPPLPYNESLWKVHSPNLGKLESSDGEYREYIYKQNWATIDHEFVVIKENGGSAGRAFRSNFDYAKILNENMQLPRLCESDTPPLMLDMGGGIGSVAAAMADARGGDRAARVVTYMLPDKFLRQQVIVTDRRLPSFVHRFEKSVPFPESSFEIVHCKWCWHHLAGYDRWLKEVNRVLAPGGYFIFTFTPDPREMLNHPEWTQALQRQNFICERKSRIILICQRRGEENMQPSCLNPRMIKGTGLHAPENRTSEFRSQIKYLTEDYRKLYGTVWPPRLLSINCRYVHLCETFEESFETDYVMHIGHPLDISITINLVKRRKIGLTHDFDRFDHIPMYPRSVDLVNVGCTQNTKDLVNEDRFWMDIHRLLRPGGVVTIMRSLCSTEFGKLHQVLQNSSFFAFYSPSGNVIVGKRID